MRNDYTDYMYHSKFFNSDGSKKQHKYTARKWVKDKWQYIYKSADKITGGKLTESHNKKFDAHMADLKSQREYGYAQAAQKKVDEHKTKVEAAKKEVEFNKRQSELKDKRETGYASEEKKKEEYRQKKVTEAKAVKKTKDMNAAADKRGDAIVNDMKDKYRREHNKKEVDQYNKASWAREASDTYFDLSNLNRIDPKDVDTTINETSKINPDYDPRDLSTSHNCGFCATAWVLRKKGYDVEAKHDDENATWNDFGDAKTGISNQDAENMFVDLSKVEINEKYGTSTFFNYVSNADKRYKVAYEGLDGNTYYRYFNDINEIIGEKEDNKRTNYSVSAEFNQAYNRPYEFEKTAAEAEQEILQNSKDGDYGILTVSWNLGGGHALNYQVENGKVVVYDGQVNESYSFEELFRSTRKINYMNCTSLIPTDNVNLVVQNRRKS